MDENFDAIALPVGPVADAILTRVHETVHPSVVNHCIRGFLFGRLLAAHDGSINDAAYDEDLLFAANVGHDLGTGNLATGKSRFEVEGADITAEVLTKAGVSAAGVDLMYSAGKVS
jgi:hypothetical protein